MLLEETEAVVSSVMDIFKKHNPSWELLPVLMSDKDFTEREVLAKHSPFDLPLPHILIISMQNHYGENGNNLVMSRIYRQDSVGLINQDEGPGRYIKFPFFKLLLHITFSTLYPDTIL